MSDVSWNGWNWYLALDSQLFFITPLLIIMIFKYYKVGLFVLCSIILSSFAIQVNALIKYSIYASPINYVPEYFDIYYKYIEHRWSPWILGIITGYFYFYHSKK